MLSAAGKDKGRRGNQGWAPVGEIMYTDFNVWGGVYGM